VEVVWPATESARGFLTLIEDSTLMTKPQKSLCRFVSCLIVAAACGLATDGTGDAVAQKIGAETLLITAVCRDAPRDPLPPFT
jgi:hypothetical protein